MPISGVLDDLDSGDRASLRRERHADERDGPARETETVRVLLRL